ncbi:hypothetical protein [Luteimonas vadosa]|uniref:Lipoprotein n=1 Tax=Luteimonas vadosa TaxID=1165507 RepID=A0ABP9DQV5_9GAMM
MIVRALRGAFCVLAVASAACAPEPRVDEDPRLRRYLEQTVAAWVQGGRCASEGLGRAGSTVYVWALCRSPANGQGMSLPVAIALDPSGRPVAHRMPRDGNRHATDLDAFFPAPVRAAMRNGQAERLRRLERRLRADEQD